MGLRMFFKTYILGLISPASGNGVSSRPAQSLLVSSTAVSILPALLACGTRNEVHKH